MGSCADEDTGVGAPGVAATTSSVPGLPLGDSLAHAWAIGPGHAVRGRVHGAQSARRPPLAALAHDRQPIDRGLAVGPLLYVLVVEGGRTDYQRVLPRPTLT